MENKDDASLNVTQEDVGITKALFQVNQDSLNSTDVHSGEKPDFEKFFKIVKRSGSRQTAYRIWVDYVLPLQANNTQKSHESSGEFAKFLDTEQGMKYIKWFFSEDSEGQLMIDEARKLVGLEIETLKQQCEEMKREIIDLKFFIKNT